MGRHVGYILSMASMDSPSGEVVEIKQQKTIELMMDTLMKSVTKIGLHHSHNH